MLLDYVYGINYTNNNNGDVILDENKSSLVHHFQVEETM